MYPAILLIGDFACVACSVGDVELFCRNVRVIDPDDPIAANEAFGRNKAFDCRQAAAGDSRKNCVEKLPTRPIAAKGSACKEDASREPFQPRA
ncbi:MAG: hypothetical protein WBV39_04450 [Rudaea sp.]